jgi:eukaryotic-like serine/threonine-protein kinase
MSEIWKRWEGQVVEHKYRLESLIGSTDHSVVFLAEYRSPEPQKAVLKFLAADIPNTENILAAWNVAAQLTHPNLQRILGTGRCKLEDMDLLYVAMEYAEENLAEIVPQRALAAEEARQALNAIVDVLVYLHGKNLTHGHICPANILAIGDQLKISSDTIESLAEKREMTREHSVYDAPEIPASLYTQAADIWSLGATLVAMLTQQPPILPFNENVDPVIPPPVKQPFLEIARNALRRSPELRWTSAQIAEQLNPSAIAAKAAVAGASATAVSTTAAAPQSASLSQVATVVPPAPRLSPTVAPLSVPLSKEPAVPLAKLPRAPLPPSRGSAPGPKHGWRETLVLPNYAVPILVAVVILVGVIALPKILRNRMQTTPNSVTASTPASSAAQKDPAKAPAPTQALAANTAATPSVKEQARDFPPPPPRAAETPSASPAVMRSKDNAPAAKARNSSDSPGRGEVLDHTLPQVSAKALSTISGTVRVVVKAHVDAVGQVTSAEPQEPGPSAYFRNQAMQAAQRWVFSSPEVNGRSVESDWLIRFEYTRDGVKAFPQQITQ